jgi:hypothetical protein
MLSLRSLLLEENVDLSSTSHVCILPPALLRPSITVTLTPSLAKILAAVSPAMPAPATSTSGTMLWKGERGCEMQECEGQDKKTGHRICTVQADFFNSTHEYFTLRPALLCPFSLRTAINSQEEKKG